MRKVFIVIALICIAVLANIDSACVEGYSETKDLTESARIIHTYYCADGSLKSDHLFNSCFYDIKSPWSVETHPLLHNPYTTRELADGQACLKDGDCYSKRCVYSRCKSGDNVPVGWSPPSSRTTTVSVLYNILKYVTLFALSFVVFALIFFGGESGSAKSPRSVKV